MGIIVEQFAIPVAIYCLHSDHVPESRSSSASALLWLRPLFGADAAELEAAAGGTAAAAG